MSRRRLVGIAILVAIFALCLVQEVRLTDAQQPMSFRDSAVYLEIATQPLRLAHLFYPKPFFVPALYRVLGNDLSAIAIFQQVLSFVSWLVLAAALGLTLQRMRTRVAAAIVCAGFLLAPYRVGWTAAILSESIDDSLTALLIATVLLLIFAARLAEGRRRTIACWAAAGVLALELIAWIMTRDTNAITAIVAVVVAGALVRIDGYRRRDRWALGLAGVTVVAACFAIWSTGVVPAAPMGLTLDADWQPMVLARGTYPVAEVIASRIVENKDSLAYFEARGLPQAAELAQAQHIHRLMQDPQLAPGLTWIAEHGKSVYARWLVSHPLARGDELAGHLWDVLAPDRLSAYMPPGWRGGSSIGITTNKLLLLALLLALPIAVLRTRRHRLTKVAIVMIASGVVGAAAAYYGDVIEINRHCYGSGQQIVLGMFIAVLTLWD